MLRLDFRSCASRLFACLLTVSPLVAFAQTAETFDVPSPFEVQIGEAECPVADEGDFADLTPAIEFMKQGPEQAVACVKYFENRFPNWHRLDRAQSLVGPFVSYLLGDGTTRGLHRHEIFLDLMGPLQEIAPDWRRRDEVDERLADIILGSVVEDPFVADFWRSAVEEADLGWKESDAARSVLPELYELAFAQSQRPEERQNQRPKSLLRELSWIQHTRLVLVTRVFDTWPKRIVWISISLLLMIFAARYLRRRRATA
jgi:hypothetical protein